jgi:hypothetical protein
MLFPRFANGDCVGGAHHNAQMLRAQRFVQGEVNNADINLKTSTPLECLYSRDRAACTNPIFGLIEVSESSLGGKIQV